MKKDLSNKGAIIASLLAAVLSPLGVANVAYAELPPPAIGAGTPTTAPETPQKPENKPPVSKPAPLPEENTPVRKTQPDKLKPLTVGGVSIRGLSDIAAVKKLRQSHTAKLAAVVTLWDGKTPHRLRRDSLGASIPFYQLVAEARDLQDAGGDIPLRFDVDMNRAIQAMKVLAGKVNHAPADASLDVENGEAVLRGGEGAELAIEGSAMRIQEGLEGEPPLNYIELVVVRQPGTSSLRQFKYLLAEFSTPYDASIRGRTTNLRMAARNVDGEIVAPGDTFSTNKAIGPRTGDGWREAKMFVNGEVVTGVGAGVCQCSTTIYNAALLANLPVLERHPHTFRVKYAEPSRDAAIYWGQKDMRWRNTTSGPIYVQTFLKGERFYARLYGVEKVNATVKVESHVLSRGSGISSEAYRVVQTSAGTTRQRLSRDYYKPH